MIDIPLGKAFAAADVTTLNINGGNFVWCEECCFFNQCTSDDVTIACRKHERKDGKNVIFKLVDLEGRGED